MTWLTSWSDGEHYSCRPQSLVVSLSSCLSYPFFLFLGLVADSSYFSDWPYLNSLRHRFPRFPPRSLCSLVLLAVFSLVYPATDTASLLLSSYFYRIGKIENFLCRACRHLSQDTFHLTLHCPATDSLQSSLFGDSLSLYYLWSRPWRVSRLLGLHGLPPCPHPSEGVG